MTTFADFQVFQPKGSDKLVAYTSFDPILVGALRRNTNAKFGDRNGRKAWTIDADSRLVANFRAAIAEAKARADAARSPAAVADLAAWYDRTHNEGGEGYNPYRGS